MVLLRSLRRASPYLYNYPFLVGDAQEERATAQLVQRLLDAHILKSCSAVFEAFDEQLMFTNTSRCLLRPMLFCHTQAALPWRGTWYCDTHHRGQMCAWGSMELFVCGQLVALGCESWVGGS